MTTIYYAHCKAIYDTPQEKRDVETLEALGFTVCNPNAPLHRLAVEQLQRSMPSADVMPYFLHLVAQCGALAFRALPQGWSIPAGVAREIDAARAIGIPVIELPSAVLQRGLTVEQTREYLHEAGER